MSTREGFTWTPQGGLKAGLPCIGAINPPEHKLPVEDHSVFDVIVIGAGYTGLVATRDLATQGLRVLLLEGRDRIGGRTWHADVEGFKYEMGGTWIHWHMPHIYREVSLYGLQDDWIVSQNEGGKEDYSSIHMDGNSRNIAHSEEVAMFKKTWGLFCDIDGQGMKETWTYPLGRQPEKLAKWDKLSCQDRLKEISDKITAEESGFLTAVLLQMGGGPLERMGFLDALRWYALGGFTPTGLNDIALSTRLRSGQSTLARRIFDHAVASGLSYAFNAPVTSIAQANGVATVTTRSNRTFKARQVVCTIPLNVLSSISFSPPLERGKVLAIEEGHTNRGNKIHADIKGPDLISWGGFATPGKGMACAIADNLTPSGDTHLVLFGSTPHSKNGIYLAEGIDKIKASVNHLLPLVHQDNITRIVYHDWYADEFAKGTWCYYPPEFATRYLDSLRRAHGRVHFANADWSHGWRGWIDGAAEQGASVAMDVQRALRALAPMGEALPGARL